MAAVPRDPFLRDYTLQCTQSGCHGTQQVQQHIGLGWRVGTRVEPDPTLPAFGRCPVCKRYSMQVSKAPEEVTTPTPNGFWKVPTT